MFDKFKKLADDFVKTTLLKDSQFNVEKNYQITKNDVTFNCHFDKRGKYDNLVRNNFKVNIKKLSDQFVFSIKFDKGCDNDVKRSIQEQIQKFVNQYKRQIKRA